jgi:hypothetical protein
MTGNSSKAGIFLNTTQLERKEIVMTRVVARQSRNNTNITHISGDFGFTKYVDCNTLWSLKCVLNQFIKNLDEILKYLHKPKAEFLIYGDKYTVYLTERKKKKK